MRLKIMILSIIILFGLMPLSSNANPPLLSSTELIENALAWDEKSISYSGEVIGDILSRGQYSWVHIFDGVNTISCFVEEEEAQKIEYCGRYGIKGDTVKIIGIFNQDCKEHGGDMDIHVSEFEIINKGYYLEKEYSYSMLLIAIIAFLVALTLVVIVIKKHKCYNKN